MENLADRVIVQPEATHGTLPFGTQLGAPSLQAH